MARGGCFGAVPRAGSTPTGGDATSADISQGIWSLDSFARPLSHNIDWTRSRLTFRIKRLWQTRWTTSRATGDMAALSGPVGVIPVSICCLVYILVDCIPNSQSGCDGRKAGRKRKPHQCRIMTALRWIPCLPSPSPSPVRVCVLCVWWTSQSWLCPEDSSNCLDIS